LILTDVNVLVYAHRKDADNHMRYRSWLSDVMQSPASFGVSDLAVSGVLRIVTHPKVFVDPSPSEVALAFANQVREQRNCVVITAGERHWSIFNQLISAVAQREILFPTRTLLRWPSRLGLNGLLPIATMRDFQV
jgi:uncharacterized protein